jgi:hypothetical protein
MKINYKALLSACSRAFAVFVALDFLLERLVGALFVISIKDQLHNASFGALFTITYFAVVYLALALIVCVYAIIRPRFASRLRAGLVTSGIFFAYTLLLMAQLMNFGLMPIRLFVIFTVLNTIELPLVMFTGMWSYGEHWETRSPSNIESHY